MREKTEIDRCVPKRKLRMADRMMKDDCGGTERRGTGKRFRVFLCLAAVFCWMAAGSGARGARPSSAPETKGKYYALLLGQRYGEGAGAEPLPAASLDVAAFGAMLGGLENTPYQASLRFDLGRDEILAEIGRAFSAAEEEDLCLLYYSGHGKASGAAARRGILIGAEGGTVSPEELLAALDQISGYKVLLLDSCYAGMLIPVLESRGKGAEKYAVLTAAGAREEAYNGKAAQGSYGWFTSAVLLGCGVQELTGERLPRVPADQNGDGAVSLREIWRFASDYLAGLSARQHPQLFLPEEDLILWVR